MRAAGSLAIAGVATQITGAAAAGSQDGAQRRLRVLVLEEPSFPAGEIEMPEQAQLLRELSAYDCAFVGLAEFASRLAARDADVVVTPHGSHFPKSAFVPLVSYLNAGGNWVNIGGVPLSVPVVREGAEWRMEASTTAYHKRLGITQAFPVDAASVAAYEKTGISLESELRFTATEIYELYVRFTETRDFPSEDGTAGARDAVLRPLLMGTGPGKEPAAAPFIVIDRLQGPYAGGRWLLANFRGTIAASAVRALVVHALDGSTELTARMSLACYREGEMPALTVRLHRPRGDARNRVGGPCHIEVFDDRNKRVAEFRSVMEGSGATAFAGADLKVARLSPGLFTVKVTLPVASATDGRSNSLGYSTGFWVFDRSLLEQGSALGVGDQYLVKDGKPYPVTGTTYMGSDVHRKFLFEPNPFIWDRDFAAMKEAGVNMVRTGIWTGWKNLMLDVGAPNESAFRAMDAFVLTARRHGIPLIMTFFAFLPESWGGSNPYLDPRSVAAQNEFVTLFTRRYRMVPEIIWDLINEPSFCSPAHLWQCRPNYDAFETAEWNAWLAKRYADAQGSDGRSRLQELYRTAADEPISLPAIEEFDDANIFNNRRPIKVIDYRLFAQEMFRRWAAGLASTIRSNGNPAQLVTVGQDEGGTYERPGNQFFADAVDFTCLHNWWLNDHLLWDSVVTKTRGKANLVEETGVMFYETMEGKAWRTEHEAADLLDRKMALALGAAGAGFIEWIWNTNAYMVLDNEAAIGFHRVDGTSKPELNAFRRYAGFIRAHRDRLVGRAEEDVLLVIPHSQMFSVRNFATEATQRSVRAMHYHCQVPMRAVSEYRAGVPGAAPKLIVVPSPRTLAADAWSALLLLAERGATLLVTGTFDRDDHWIPNERISQFGVRSESRPVAQEEELTIGGAAFRLSFRGDKIQRLEKAVIAGGGMPAVMTFPLGTGRVIWSPLPVELAEQIEPTVALYELALQSSGVVPALATKERDPSILVLPTLFEEVILATIVSESDMPKNIALIHRATGAAIAVELPPQKGTMLVLDRATGALRGRMP